MFGCVGFPPGFGKLHPGVSGSSTFPPDAAGGVALGAYLGSRELEWYGGVGVEAFSSASSAPTPEDQEQIQNQGTLHPKLEDREQTQSQGDLHPELEEIAAEKRERVATKADDAAVPVELWRQQLVDFFPGRDLQTDEFKQVCELADKLEVLALRRWRRNIWQEWRKEVYPQTKRVMRCYAKVPKTTWRGDYVAWHALRRQHLKDEVEFGLEVLEKSARATWWEWSGGSILYYWRWDKIYRKRAKEGLKVYFTEPRPNTLTRQKAERDEEQRKKIQKKVSKVLERRYLGSGAVRSLISFFAVPKGMSDIRVVYNGTS